MRAARPTLSDRIERAAPAGDGTSRAAVTLAATTVAALLIGGAYLYLTPTRVTAASKLLVERVAGPTTAESVAVVNGPDAFLAAQADVLRSTEVLRLADATANLGTLPTLVATRDPLPTIRRSLRAESAGNGGVLTVTYSSTSADDARRVVDAVVRAYVSYQSDKRRERVADLTAAAEANRRPLAEQADRAARLAAEADAALAQRGNADAIAQRVRINIDGLMQAQIAAVDAKRQYDDAVADAGPLLSKLSDEDLDRALRASGLEQNEGGGRVAERLEAAVRQLAEMKRTFAGNHPAVVRMRGQIDRLRVERVAAARQRWQAVVARENEWKQASERAQGEAAALAALTVERDRQRAQLARLQARLDDADRQLDRARGVASGATLNVEVITTAEVDDPRYPPTPRPLPALGLALIAGLAVGGTLATIGEYRRAGTLRHVAPKRAGRSSEATLARDAFGLRVLASVPELPAPAGTADQASKLRADPAGPLARAADTLGAAIVIEGFERGTLLVTSQRDGEGRSTIARALAAAFTRAGSRVLLIDAALPRVGADGGDGFADALVDGVLEGRVTETSTDGLWQLPAGRPRRDAADLLNSTRLADVLAMCAETFDQVIVDAPPLSAGDDVQVLAASCDAAVLVSDGAVASLRRAASGRDVLQLVGARVLGVVINRTKYAVEPGGNGPREASAR